LPRFQNAIGSPECRGGIGLKALESRGQVAGFSLAKHRRFLGVTISPKIVTDKVAGHAKTTPSIRRNHYEPIRTKLVIIQKLSNGHRPQ
jgi:hypothetical protein